MLYAAWKHGGEDPYRLYHSLGPDYRPWDLPDAEPLPPASGKRVRNLIYAFALYAHEETIDHLVASSAGAVQKSVARRAG